MTAQLSVDRIKGLASGLGVKAPVRTITDSPITLSGEQTINGVGVVDGDRVLVNDQADPIENGIYDVSTGPWTRSRDFDGRKDVVNGTMVVINEGTFPTTPILFSAVGTDPITPGTSAVTFVPALNLITATAYMLTLFDDPDSATALATLQAVGLSLDNTITGNNTLSGDNTLSGTNTFTGVNLFSSTNTFDADQIFNGAIIFEGATADAFETTLTVVDPTADRTATLPDASLTIAGVNLAQNWTASQRAAATTDNDLSFDLAAANNFKSTPTGSATLTFTNIAGQAGQCGYILLVNTTNYAVALHANTKMTAGDVAAVSATGTYVISYFCDGTNVYCTASGDLS